MQAHLIEPLLAADCLADCLQAQLHDRVSLCVLFCALLFVSYNYSLAENPKICSFAFDVNSFCLKTNFQDEPEPSSAQAPAARPRTSFQYRGRTGQPLGGDSSNGKTRRAAP